MPDRRTALALVCTERRIRAVYLFGSRGDDGRRVLEDEEAGPGSDLDVGVVLERGAFDPVELGPLQADLEEVFRPLRVDLVPLLRVDALFQYAAVNGHRVFAASTTEANLYELEVMRRAAELLPIQRRPERETFGVSPPPASRDRGCFPRRPPARHPPLTGHGAVSRQCNGPPRALARPRRGVARCRTT